MTSGRSGPTITHDLGPLIRNRKTSEQLMARRPLSSYTCQKSIFRAQPDWRKFHTWTMPLDRARHRGAFYTASNIIRREMN